MAQSGSSRKQPAEKAGLKPEDIITAINGKPLKDVEIKITRTDIKGNYKIKTDKNGKYNYATLPQGMYDIEMTASGQTKSRRRIGSPCGTAKPGSRSLRLIAFAFQ